jgi:hypothetical protein
MCRLLDAAPAGALVTAVTEYPIHRSRIQGSMTAVTGQPPTGAFSNASSRAALETGRSSDIGPRERRPNQASLTVVTMLPSCPTGSDYSLIVYWLAIRGVATCVPSWDRESSWLIIIKGGER